MSKKKINLFCIFLTLLSCATTFVDANECRDRSTTRSKKHARSHFDSIATPRIYQNPFMSPNNFSEIHNDAYQTDTFSLIGPAVFKKTRVQSSIISADGSGEGYGSGTTAFTTSGQLVVSRSSRVLGSAKVTLLLLNPKDYSVISSLQLSSFPAGGGSVNFAGAYYYLNQLDQIVCVTASQQIRVYKIENREFVLVQEFNVSSAINNPNDFLQSIIPDSEGNIWFITTLGGVGYVSHIDRTVNYINLRDLPYSNPNEVITNSLASDENKGVFIVSDYALYRFQVGLLGEIDVTWTATYDRGTRQKPGQTSQGTGTTPTLFNDFKGNQFVAITDNADPYMHLLVYERNTGELIIQKELFKDYPYLNCTENSIIAVDHSLIIENNYGFRTFADTLGALTTVPGLTRIDIDPKTKTAKKKWTTYKLSIPSVVSKLSTKDGHIYTYAKDQKGWYWAAIDFNTGKIKKTARVPDSGTAQGSVIYNNFYSGITIGPDSSVNVCTLGGFCAWRPIK